MKNTKVSNNLLDDIDNLEEIAKKWQNHNDSESSSNFDEQIV